MALVALGACTPGSSPPVPAIYKLAFADGAVVVPTPWGYCADPDAIRNDGASGFALLGNCATITGRVFVPQPADRVVLTVAVRARRPGVPTIAEEIDTLDAFFTSSAGRRALALSGDGSGVEVIETRAEDGIFYVLAREAGRPPASGLADRWWRAYFDVGNHIVSIAVIATEAEDVADTRALTILKGLALRIRKASPAHSAG